MDNNEAISILNENGLFLSEDFTFVKKLCDAVLFESGSYKLHFYTAHLKAAGTKYSKHVVSCASWAMDEDEKLSVEDCAKMFDVPADYLEGWPESASKSIEREAAAYLGKAVAEFLDYKIMDKNTGLSAFKTTECGNKP